MYVSRYGKFSTYDLNEHELIYSLKRNVKNSFRSASV